MFILTYNSLLISSLTITFIFSSVYRKSTHTGQYQHITSFSPWSRKVAWIRALVNRTYKICSNKITLLKDKLKAAFRLRVFCADVYARKSLNLSNFYTSSSYLVKNKLNHVENLILYFYSFSCSMGNI